MVPTLAAKHAIALVVAAAPENTVTPPAPTPIKFDATKRASGTMRSTSADRAPRATRTDLLLCAAPSRTK
jgi:hypothetical protein